MELINHLEKYLGQIQEGWKPKENFVGIQCVKFSNQPTAGVTTYTTIGLSNYILKLNEKEVRQELVFSIYQTQETTKIAEFLVSFAESICKTGKALLRGETIGPHSNIYQGSPFSALYASLPVFFEEEFYVLKSSVPSTVFVWLMPLYIEELEFIIKNGWNKFEDILEKANCDFWDSNRPIISLILPSI